MRHKTSGLLMGALLGAFLMAGCAPIRSVPVPMGIEKIEPQPTPLPADRTFGRNRLRDQKRRNRVRATKRSGGRKRGR